MIDERVVEEAAKTLQDPTFNPVLTLEIMPRLNIPTGSLAAILYAIYQILEREGYDCSGPELARKLDACNLVHSKL